MGRIFINEVYAAVPPKATHEVGAAVTCVQSVGNIQCRPEVRHGRGRADVTARVLGHTLFDLT